MKKKGKIKSNIIGLDIGLAFGRFFLDTEDLHLKYSQGTIMSNVYFQRVSI